MSSSDEPPLKGPEPLLSGDTFMLNLHNTSSTLLRLSAESSTKIKTLAAANQFLTEQTESDRSPYLTVPVLRIHPNQSPSSESRAVLHELGRQNRDAYRWCAHVMKDASSGNLEGSLRSGRILIEAPPCENGPYLFFYLAELDNGKDELYRRLGRQQAIDLKPDRYEDNIIGIYMYSESDFDILDCAQKQYTDLSQRNLNRGSSLGKLHPFHGIAVSMVCSVLSAHIKWNWANAEAVYDEVATIEQELRESITCEMSDMTARINDCSRKIRQLGLERRRDFHLKAIVWLDELLKEAQEQLPVEGRRTARQLLEYHKFDWLNDPHMLEKQIAEARALLNEKIIRQQQEQNVELQRKIVEQQENMKMIQEQSFKLTQRLAEEAERDRIATHARQEANARLTQLSASIARQSLELARESRRESRTMRGIGWVTMGFLPATFVASFFGMNFFNVIKEKPYFDEAAKSVWVFFVFAIPISAIVLWQFYRWDAKSEEEALRREKAQRKETVLA